MLSRCVVAFIITPSLGQSDLFELDVNSYVLTNREHILRITSAWLEEILYKTGILCLHICKS